MFLPSHFTGLHPSSDSEGAPRERGFYCLRVRSCTDLQALDGPTRVVGGRANWFPQELPLQNPLPSCPAREGASRPFPLQLP